ncbi:hypothetical protein PCYB_102860 [Plasmodium cynomolgi strain B]|uniref:Uncharacterized protein n=1 Tax=Plasmodium cynomolgi (strain B) TaxID=1120755 RepID=K6UDP0_PLACD|nr:hypothetical protein PCYB_102860 [Plasmodium cynomolgi strain B]GAB66936.1 hypothetical protein PCYB_102860 [Plasmodium cynomolgi strain B]
MLGRLLRIAVLLPLLSVRVRSENDISVKGSLTVANLKISSKGNKENGILFQSKEVEYKMGMNPLGHFIISRKNKPIISIDEHDNMNLLNQDLVVKTLTIDGIFKVRHVNQFQMIVHEMFSSSTSTKGWLGDNFDNFTSVCGGINMLGGYGKLSKGRVHKIFENIPSHTQIRIKANFHFIDEWNSHTAYLKVGRDDQEDLFYVWTDSHSSKGGLENAVNICGNTIGESKFSSVIDVVIPHNSSKLIVEFGTTIQVDDPKTVSWGISNFQLFIV